MREYLIYTSAGEDANVKVWASSKTRNYDIWVTNYTDQPGLNSEYADFYNEHGGSKISTYTKCFSPTRITSSSIKPSWSRMTMF